MKRHLAAAKRLTLILLLVLLVRPSSADTLDLTAPLMKALDELSPLAMTIGPTNCENALIAANIPPNASAFLDFMKPSVRLLFDHFTQNGGRLKWVKEPSLWGTIAFDENTKLFDIQVSTGFQTPPNSDPVNSFVSHEFQHWFDLHEMTRTVASHTGIAPEVVAPELYRLMASWGSALAAKLHYVMESRALESEGLQGTVSRMKAVSQPQTSSASVELYVEFPRKIHAYPAIQAIRFLLKSDKPQPGDLAPELQPVAELYADKAIEELMKIYRIVFESEAKKLRAQAGTGAVLESEKQRVKAELQGLFTSEAVMRNLTAAFFGIDPDAQKQIYAPLILRRFEAIQANFADLVSTNYFDSLFN